MKTTAQCVKDMAAFLDSNNRQAATIRVEGTRRALMRAFKPAKRGGPLLAGTHELVIVRKLDRPRPLESQAMFETA